jgi:hypothetical protein
VSLAHTTRRKHINQNDERAKGEGDNVKDLTFTTLGGFRYGRKNS